MTFLIYFLYVENLIISFLNLCYGTNYYTVSAIYYNFEHSSKFVIDENGIPSTFYCYPTNTIGYKFKDEVLLYKKDDGIIIQDKLIDVLSGWFSGISKDVLTNTVHIWFYSCSSCGCDTVSRYIV